MFERKDLRLKDYDYASPGMYFVTICTYGRVERLSKIVGETLRGLPHAIVRYSRFGKVVDFRWRQIEKRFDNVSVGEYVIMPNHVHGIIEIHGRVTRGRPRRVSPTSLFDVLYWFKSITTSDYVHGVQQGSFDRFDKRLWQRSYYDHIIRNNEDLIRIMKYIHENPSKWHDDEYYT